MSPWNEKRSPRWPVYAGIACVAAAMIAGLLMTMGVLGGEDDDSAAATPAKPATSTTGPTQQPAGAKLPEGPEIVSWGQQGRQLALVVRNDSTEVIDQARVRITGRDDAGRQVVSITGPDNHVCCTIFGLPPGEEFGLYAPLRPGVATIAEVSVDYVSPQFGAAGEKTGEVVARGGKLHRSADNTVVTATLTAKGPVGDYVAAQAFLVDRKRDIAQVISGRYWCYESGTRRRIRLELFRAVPPNLRLDKVVAHPIPQGVPAGVKGRC